MAIRSITLKSLNLIRVYFTTEHCMKDCHRTRVTYTCSNPHRPDPPLWGHNKAPCRDIC